MTMVYHEGDLRDTNSDAQVHEWFSTINVNMTEVFFLLFFSFSYLFSRIWTISIVYLFRLQCPLYNLNPALIFSLSLSLSRFCM